MQGEDLQVTKVPEGDCPRQEYQRRAEGLWERNAEEVVEVMTTLVRAARRRVVMVAGDGTAAVLRWPDHG